MDYRFDRFSDSMDGFVFDLQRLQNPPSGLKENRESVDPLLILTNPQPPGHSTSSTSPEADSPDSHDFSNVVLKYISEMLMNEEDLEHKPCMLQDCLALQAAEKRLYDVLYPPPSPELSSPSAGEVVDEDSSPSGDSSTGPGSPNLEWVCGQGGFESGRRNSSSDMFNHETFSVESFMKHVDGSKFLPGGKFKLEDNSPFSREVSTNPNESRFRKNHQREESDDFAEEGRNSKHSAGSVDDYEPPEMFDKVLLCLGEKPTFGSYGPRESLEINGDKKLKGKKQSRGSKGKNRSKKLEENKDMIDLWTLLNQCAQSVATFDQITAKQLVKQIRQHSSPYGDGLQRLAHYIVNGLETRLAAGTPLYMPYASRETSAAQILKAYQTFITACPFKRMSNFFANRTILKLTEKATRIHIIDFGILYGFQWPCLIQRLSLRQGGPPHLRITGIELPQPGFRPAERVEQTGRRLENYCKRFGVPFEYKGLAQKWETVNFDDLKIDRDELTVVNCMYRLKNIPDETVVANSPRDTVLKLIKKVNPDLFIHGVSNGTYNAPFFLTRFKEAMFHFSSLFDMFEATVEREDPHRQLYEREALGRDAINVIACEGLERVERPETYKQWQLRNTRHGFKQVALNQDLLQKVKDIVKSEYHEDFVVDQDGKWLLQGWKGRIVNALSCWVAA